MAANSFLGADFKAVLMLEIEFRFWPYFSSELAHHRRAIALILQTYIKDVTESQRWNAQCGLSDH